MVFVISWHVTHFQIESCGGRLTGRILGVNDSKFAINSNRKFRHSTLPSDLQQMFVRLVNGQCVVCRDYDDVFYKVVDISAIKRTSVLQNLLSIVNFHSFTLCLKKRSNFETVQLEIIRLDFDDIWQKYSEDSGIEFACFSFHAGLLFSQLLVFQTASSIYHCVWQCRCSA